MEQYDKSKYDLEKPKTEKKKNDDFDLLLGKKAKAQQEQEIMNQIMRENRSVSFDNCDSLSQNLSSALKKAKQKKNDKKVYQVYLTNELIIAIDNFCRKNDMSKTDAVEMLIRLSLNLPQR